ncbi:hypothetical protein AGABI2DRAFT_195789 [Agaricus bisporus var. bisporus H97]|uniref:1-aminocyclopropane-1-carboxylate oxidase n=1 Tax=Agaricus bisporus TaxID=5341 RepID=H9ZYN5_AGABI|nr:hypothetical protein AGABI2DRAFT_195789 [Agaricus bisporus var. bisporus H97]AFH41842.1 1-aminocyclopropane-1-carboxylate oxidase [Agaricus bisporus]EKV42453.1 hypothetical protein AGABI2DRAFT_195789 [Agaricus bisporus var. bisporus H97]
MTIITQPPVVPHFVQAETTKENLDWADLDAVDLSKAKTHEGRKGLVKQVHDAMKNDGFLFVTNHSVTPQQMSRMFDLSNYAVDNVSDEEKQKYVGNMRENGTYRGYKPRKFWHIAGGVRDQIEQYNMNFREIKDGTHPEPLRPFLSEIDDFSDQIHSDIINTILRLIAMSLELDEDYFIQMHDRSANAETFLRFVNYFPHPEEEENKSGGVWLKGHTDFMTLTLLFSQPVASLQIMTKDGQWKWVKHVENGVLVNIGEAIEFLTGGYYKPTIHRVRQPPLDQQNKTRVGLLYFCSAHDDVVLRPIAESPVVQKGGDSESRLLDDKFPTAGEYGKARVMAYGGTQALKQDVQKGIDEEVVAGVLLRHYN